MRNWHFAIEKKLFNECLSFVKYELTESIYLILESMWHLRQKLNAKSTLTSKVISEQNVSRKNANAKIFGRILHFFAKTIKRIRRKISRKCENFSAFTLTNV